MTIKEKLALLERIRKANEQRLKAWKERKTNHGDRDDGRKLQG